MIRAAPEVISAEVIGVADARRAMELTDVVEGSGLKFGAVALPDDFFPRTLRYTLVGGEVEERALR
ncbi:hypothetical protein [Amycolatopsis sp. NPDC051371]|uniref:hypothetical protein n=1 Tax=Amycolatopsis sp. NPDC051371 TaxID=3155800 RepID=UPI003433B6A8